jgi:hypothetical protein
MLINIYKGHEVLSNQTLFKKKKFCIPGIRENKTFNVIWSKNIWSTGILLTKCLIDTDMTLSFGWQGFWRQAFCLETFGWHNVWLTQLWPYHLAKRHLAKGIRPSKCLIDTAMTLSFGQQAFGYIHLTNKHSADMHLVDMHLADTHFSNRHLAILVFDWHIYDPAFGQQAFGRQAFGRQALGRQGLGRQTFYQQSFSRQTFGRHYI